MFSGIELQNPKNFLIFLNGQILGIHANPELLVDRFKLFRRSGKIGEFVSINLDRQSKTINISSDYGRLLRPYIIVKNKKALLTQEHLDAIVKKYLLF